MLFATTVRSRSRPATFLFSNVKKLLAGRKFCADEEVIAVTEEYEYTRYLSLTLQLSY